MRVNNKCGYGIVDAARTSQTQLAGVVTGAAADGSWVARLKAPPVDGKANEELIALVADHFRCRKAAVRITAGATGRLKRLSIDVRS